MPKKLRKRSLIGLRNSRRTIQSSLSVLDNFLLMLTILVSSSLPRLTVVTARRRQMSRPRRSLRHIGGSSVRRKLRLERRLPLRAGQSSSTGLRSILTNTFRRSVLIEKLLLKPTTVTRKLVPRSRRQVRIFTKTSRKTVLRLSRRKLKKPKRLWRLNLLKPRQPQSTPLLLQHVSSVKPTKPL